MVAIFQACPVLHIQVCKNRERKCLVSRFPQIKIKKKMADDEEDYVTSSMPPIRLPVFFTHNSVISVTYIYSDQLFNFRLKSKMNVATIDTDSNPELKKRFKIKKCPTLILWVHYFSSIILSVVKSSVWKSFWKVNACTKYIGAPPVCGGGF